MFLQPFSSQIKRRYVKLAIACVWVISSGLALIPTVEKYSTTFYQSVNIKSSLYFKQLDVSSQDLVLLASKLFVYQPELKNMTKMEREAILNTNSWSTMNDFLNKTIKGGFEIDGSYG